MFPMQNEQIHYQYLIPNRNLHMQLKSKEYLLIGTLSSHVYKDSWVSDRSVLLCVFKLY